VDIVYYLVYKSVIPGIAGAADVVVMAVYVVYLQQQFRKQKL